MLSRRDLSATALLSVLLLGMLCGCSAPPTAQSVTASLGAVPIPTAPAVDPMPTATIGKPQLLAMGASTLVILDPATRGIATATGPDQRITQPAASGTASLPGATTSATITLAVKSASGSISLAVSDLVCRNQTGAVIPLTAVGPSSATATAGDTAQLVVSGTFTSGAAQVTWQPAGHPLALWDFTIELD